ncbi:MAG: hypothetical protein AAF413_04325 [Patescibacteria group bacterium]
MKYWAPRIKDTEGPARLFSKISPSIGFVLDQQVLVPSGKNELTGVEHTVINPIDIMRSAIASGFWISHPFMGYYLEGDINVLASPPDHKTDLFHYLELHSSSDIGASGLCLRETGIGVELTTLHGRLHSYESSDLKSAKDEYAEQFVAHMQAWGLAHIPILVADVEE